MKGWMDAATLMRTLNLQGRFLARAAEDLPFLLREGMTCALVPPVTDAPRMVTVTSVEAAQGKHEGGFCVTFAEVDAMAEAELLVGCHCLVRESEAEVASEGRPAEALARSLAANPLAVDDAALLDEAGWSVVDERAGRIGELLRVEERPAQSLLVVEREGAPEALIPLVDEIVGAIDEEARVINVRVPAGLLEL